MQRAAVELEDAEQAWTPEDERAFVAELPPAVRDSIDEIVATADTKALKNALQAILGIVLMALLVSVFISPATEAPQTTPSFDNKGG